MSKLLYNIMKFPKKNSVGYLGRWNTIIDLNETRDISKDIEKIVIGQIMTIVVGNYVVDKLL